MKLSNKVVLPITDEDMELARQWAQEKNIPTTIDGLATTMKPIVILWAEPDESKPTN